MQARVAALLLLAGLAAAAYPTVGAPPGPPVERAYTLRVEEIACATETDGMCLAYNGQIPGPMLDVNLGDTLVITLENHHSRAVSWHVHGTALAADMDGIAAHPGTQLVESVAPPGGSYTYRVRAAFAGSWHYHDHVLGPDGSEGVRRGLYGGLIVRNGAEPRPDAVIDVHTLDAGVNGGRWTDVTVVGTSFEVLAVGLGNALPTVSLRGPTGATLDSAQLGPGLSERLDASPAAPGVYQIRAPGFRGNVTVVAP